MNSRRSRHDTRAAVRSLIRAVDKLTAAQHLFRLDVQALRVALNAVTIRPEAAIGTYPLPEHVPVLKEAKSGIPQAENAMFEAYLEQELARRLAL